LRERLNPFTVESAVIDFEQRLSKGLLVSRVLVDQKNVFQSFPGNPARIVREKEIGNCPDVYMCLDEYPIGRTARAG
jgi:hypothetical protein